MVMVSDRAGRLAAIRCDCSGWFSRMLKCAVAAVLLVLVAITRVAAQDASAEAPPDAATHATGTLIAEVLERTGAALEWNPVAEAGLLVKGTKAVSFKLGAPVMLLDYLERHDASVRRTANGDLLFSPETAATIVSHLGASTDGTASRSEPVSGGRLRVVAVMLDPGHGGRDHGALRQVDGAIIREKDIVLDIGRRLSVLLERDHPDRRIVLTRDEDVYLQLEERTDLANELVESTGEHERVIFVSIHANASLNSRSRGFEVWYLPPDYRRELIDPTSLEEGERDLHPILNTMLEEEYTRDSVLLAQDLVAAMDGAVGDTSPNRGTKEEVWFVVRNARMPAVLVEVGFVSNPDEARDLTEDAYLQRISEALYSGISTFISRYESIVGLGP